MKARKNRRVGNHNGSTCGGGKRLIIRLADVKAKGTVVRLGDGGRPPMKQLCRPEGRRYIGRI